MKLTPSIILEQLFSPSIMQKIFYLLALAAPALAFPSFNKDNNLDQHMNVARNVLERKANKGKSPAQIISAARTNCGMNAKSSTSMTCD